MRAGMRGKGRGDGRRSSGLPDMGIQRPACLFWQCLTIMQVQPLFAEPKYHGLKSVDMTVMARVADAFRSQRSPGAPSC